jgi:hypothetical protein
MIIERTMKEFMLVTRDEVARMGSDDCSGNSSFRMAASLVIVSSNDMLQATLDTDQRQCPVAARSAAENVPWPSLQSPVFYRECRLALAHYGLDPERELAVLERVSLVSIRTGRILYSIVHRYRAAMRKERKGNEGL